MSDQRQSKGEAGPEVYIRRYIHKALMIAARITYMMMRSHQKSERQVMKITRYQHQLVLETHFQSVFTLGSITYVGKRAFDGSESMWLVYTKLEELDQLIARHLELSSERAKKKILRYDRKKDCFQYTFRTAMQIFFRELGFDYLEKEKYKKLAEEDNTFVEKVIVSPKMRKER